ncbi:MAG: hypothetical protein WEC75_03275 [Dehalococcoidia bacterium]
MLAGDRAFDVNANGTITNGDGVLVKQAAFNYIPCQSLTLRR